MNNSRFTKISGGISKSIESMLTREKKMQGWLNTVAYKTYQNAQRKRWMSENDSEGLRWKPINALYRQQKLKRFASFPGGGRKTMIATDRLRQSVVGPSPDHRKLTTTKSITILTSVPYANEVDKERTFTTFSDKFKEDLIGKAMAYLAKGTK